MKTYKVTDRFVVHFVYLILICVVTIVYSLLITCLYLTQQYELARAKQIQQFATIINDSSK